jgi:hypothetical protein
MGCGPCVVALRNHDVLRQEAQREESVLGDGQGWTVILTVPHSVPSNLYGPHASDFSASLAAEKIKRALRDDGFLHVWVHTGTINRAEVADLNRFSRDNPEWVRWQKELKTIIDSERQGGRKVILLDIHSYPGTEAMYTISEDMKEYAFRMSQTITGQDPKQGAGNSILIESTGDLSGRGKTFDVDKALLIEFNETEESVFDETAKKIVKAVRYETLGEA